MVSPGVTQEGFGDETASENINNDKVRIEKGFFE